MSTMYPSAYAKVNDLIDRTLLVCEGEKIEVHGLLKEMAWNIVNNEPKLGKRSRLVDPEDIHKLLTTEDIKGWSTSFFFNLFKVGEMILPRRKSAKVVDNHWKARNPLAEYRETQGISLNLEKAKEMYLEANAFDGMNSLTFLKIWGSHLKKIHLPYGGLNSLPDGLRWLEWCGYPSKSLPSKFYPQHLVHLKIRYSPIQRCWEGYNQPQLVNLVALDLSYCRNLVAIPNISSSLNLEELCLCECESLVEVPSYVQYLTKLITLDLGGCQNLKRLPPKLDSKLLKHVKMWGCLKVTHCPEIISRELVEFDLNATSLEELPNAIYNVKQNGGLHLSGTNITKFPAVTTSLRGFWLRHTSITDIDLDDYQHHHQTPSEIVFPRFKNLYFIDNRQLKSLPKSIWNMVYLELNIHGSPLIESLPEISEPVTTGLADLYITKCGSLKSLPSSISNITSLQSLNLSETGVKSLPSSIQELRELHSIHLNDCKSLETIPGSICKLLNLKYLYMNGCESIPSLPELPPNLQLLSVNCCKSLQALPSNTGKLLHLNKLHFEKCPQLDQTIPADIVENFLVRASLSLSPQYPEVVCSRSKLPEWLTYKSTNLKEEENCSVEVKLPLPNDCDQLMVMKGIAFGLMFSSDVGINMRCHCKMGDTTIASWSHHIRNFSTDHNSSELLWLKFDKKVVGITENEAWYVKYIGLLVSFNFHISNHSGSGKLKEKPKIKKMWGLSALLKDLSFV